MPSVAVGAASTTPSAGPSPAAPTSGRTTVDAEDLVVVAVDRAGLRGDVRVRQQGEQRGGGIGRRCGWCGRCGSVSGSSACMRRCGRPSWRKVVSMSTTVSPPLRTTSRPSPVNDADVGDVDADSVASLLSAHRGAGAARPPPCAPGPPRARPPTARARRTCAERGRVRRRRRPPRPSRRSPTTGRPHRSR